MIKIPTVNLIKVKCEDRDIHALVTILLQEFGGWFEFAADTVTNDPDPKEDDRPCWIISVDFVPLMFISDTSQFAIVAAMRRFLRGYMWDKDDLYYQRKLR